MPGKLWCKYTVVSVEQERLSFEIGGLDDTGENIWYSGFTVNIDDNNFFKDLTFIESGYQNEDLGTLLMSRCYELARLLKLDQIRLHAMWAGAYAWARFGFIPNKAEWNDTMKANVTSRLLVLKKDIPHKLFLEMLRFLESEDPAVVWSIADERYPVPSAEMSDEDGQPLQIPLGRALLAESGTSWYGFLDLSDQLAVERFEEYVGVV
ncbi:hypothetical protein [Azospirillum argentinense]|nr:hypothetical protein [Azospirillum argentinense]